MPDGWDSGEYRVGQVLTHIATGRTARVKELVARSVVLTPDDPEAWSRRAPPQVLKILLWQADRYWR